jgi:hypothetical protein
MLWRGEHGLRLPQLSFGHVADFLLERLPNRFKALAPP